MAFEVYKASFSARLKTGCATIARNGAAKYSTEDFRSVGISDAATILIDRDAETIGVRAPRKGELNRAVARKKDESPTIYLGGAMLALGLKPSEHTGSREVNVKDGVIVMDFSEIHG